MPETGIRSLEWLNLQIHIVRSTSAFGRNPGDDLVGVHDVTGLAVNAVGGVERQLLALPVAAVHHLVDIGRTKSLAGVAEFFGAAGMTDIEVADKEMGRLILFVLRA